MNGLYEVLYEVYLPVIASLKSGGVYLITHHMHTYTQIHIYTYITRVIHMCTRVNVYICICVYICVYMFLSVFVQSSMSSPDFNEAITSISMTLI